MTSTNLTHISYKGMGPAITDLPGGQTQFVFATILPIAPHVRSGRLRALGVSSEKRSSILPDLPTIAEYKSIGPDGKRIYTDQPSQESAPVRLSRRRHVLRRPPFVVELCCGFQEKPFSGNRLALL